VAAQLAKQITTAPLRTFRTRDLDTIYTQPNVQLHRLVQQGAVRRVAHGLYYSVPDDKPDTWVPTVEALGAGVATALFGEQVPVLMHLTAARLHGALPRAIGQVFVAAPKQHRAVQIHDIGQRDAVVVFIQRKVDELDALLLSTDLGDALVTTLEQTVLDLAKRPQLGGMPDECHAAIRGLFPRCDDTTLAALAREQRMQRTLDRIRAGHGQVRS
jgi:predicted transcriptional regulator of viral defense system